MKELQKRVDKLERKLEAMAQILNIEVPETKYYTYNLEGKVKVSRVRG